MADQEVRSSNFVPALLAQDSLNTRAAVALWADKTTHRLLVDAGTITTSSATAGATGSAVPASADYIGVSSGGTLVGLALGQTTMALSLPVTIASNQASIPVAATLSAETTKVIGTVNQGTSPWVENISQINGSTAFPIETNTFADSKIGFMAFARTTGTGAGATVKALIVDSNNNLGVNIADIGGSAVTLGSKTSANSFPVVIASDQAANALWGHGATGSAVPANAVYNGAQARSSELAAATNGNLGGLVTDLVNKLIVLPYANPENFVNGTTGAITDTTSTSTIAAQGAGVRTYITTIIVTNSHATVGTFVKILDGASIIAEGYAAAAGGGFVATFPTPLRGTANTAVNTQCVTTGANVIATVAGYKGV